MGKLKDLTGQRYGYLVVLEQNGRSASGNVKWLALCDCGEKTTATSGNLQYGSVASCGCRRFKHAQRSESQHGPLMQTSEYQTWASMLARCGNPKDKFWRRYGGRGIHVCERWRRFDHFFADMGRKPSPRHSIDRVNNDGNYEPGNCRWATSSEQLRNRRWGYKLTPETVALARSRFAQGETRQQIADSLHVSRALIGLVVARKIWSHVT
jgi:hypothetical protein